MKRYLLAAVAIAAVFVIAHTPAARSADMAPVEKAPVKNGWTQDVMKVSNAGVGARPVRK